MSNMVRNAGLGAMAVAAALACGGVRKAGAALPEPNDARMKVAPSVSLAAVPFELSDVRLLDGPFKEAMGRDAKYLLELEPDRLLHRVRTEAGLTPKGKIYGGWESAGVSSHILGHYLSACSMMYASTGEARFKQRVDHVVDEMAECQRANGNGYVAGIPDSKKLWADLEAGHIDTANHALNGAWVPWYTMHKLFAGLRDAYLYTGNERAKAVLVGLSDWACAFSSHLDDAQFQHMLECEFGGMNEVLADVYAMTGERKYLDLSERFNHKRVLDPLMHGEDDLNGLHANTQIPKIIGLATEYELTGDADFRNGAEFFWQDVTGKRSYANGGNSDGEHFFPVGKTARHLGASSSETCNTYNMLKLTGHLFAWDPKPAYVEYYERALYNHILASQDPRSGMMTYYVPMKPGQYKTFSTPFDAFWCCVGTGIENHSKYGGAIYARGDAGLYVNLFIASELDWKEKGLTVRQETRFPEEGATKLSITAAQPTEATINLRHPAWADGMAVTVNGEAVGAGTPSSFVAIKRQWKSGDVIDVKLPMALRTEPIADAPDKVAIFYGPILLAGDLGSAGIVPPLPLSSDNLMHAKVPAAPVPVLVTNDRPVGEWLKPVEGKPLTFTTAGVGKPNDATLIPFYAANGVHYTVYWGTFTPAGWAAKQAAYDAEQARAREEERRNIDTVHPGEMQSERDHDLRGVDTRSGPFADRQWRDAFNGGWFAYDLKVTPDAPVELACTYWGSDAGARTFDVIVDDQKIATQTLADNKPDAMFDVTYALPAELTKGKRKVTVKFKGHPGNMAGGVFGIATRKAQ